MTKELSGVYSEWKFLRSNTIEMIKEFGDEKMDILLSRPELNSFKKHFLEMINVQESYSNAILSKEMTFDDIKGNDDFIDEVSSEELLSRIEHTDRVMKERLENAAHDLVIEYEDGPKTLTSHLCALNSHEIFHIGQLVGFCYAQNIEIPKYVVEAWALSEQ